MSDLQDLLKTREAEKMAAAKTAAPAGWERGNERLGDRGVGCTGPMEPGETATEAVLLDRAGFDPDEWMIVGDIGYREWDANVGGGVIKTMQYRKFSVRRRQRTDHDFEEVIKSVGRKRRQPVSGRGAGTFHFANGDWQLGKADGDGVQGTVDRIVASIDAGAAAFKQSRKKETAFAHLTFLGDCMEGFVSQGGKNAWRTELTLTEQIRLMRRLMLYGIDAFAPLTERLTVVSIPGNHDEAMRQPVGTTYDDSFAVDALVAIQDAMNLNPAAYGHVETYVPRRDSLTVTLDVNGTVITHAHGHQWRPNKHWDWWKGQAFEPSNDISQSTLLLSAHGHHFQVDSKGSHTWVMTPAQEQLSTWWFNQTGDMGAPGALTFTTENGLAKGFTIV